ncbi:hypothetical protein VNO78_11801 [Psophocarpus tetragonolobus]|uniref:Uncharacterized protein n=1 Tax=Psophocarpus tetragonolobus TaxID=3891 RepID=A0AAN9SN05_PSOTE
MAYAENGTRILLQLYSLQSGRDKNYETVLLVYTDGKSSVGLAVKERVEEWETTIVVNGDMGKMKGEVGLVMMKGKKRKR